ncbi:MAG: cation:proton antiporter [Bdellovibrionota bacterium]|nr:cation:proton antiporter [Bdellovibrionota bacterium]
MDGSFVKDIAIALGVAAITIHWMAKFRLPSVIGYLLAGFLVGPYIPIPLFANPERLQSLSEFGVVLVMFSIGMDFKIRKFFKVLPSSGLIAFVEVSAMYLVGHSLGSAFGASSLEAIFWGGALAVSSSTMIVSKLFEAEPPSTKTKDQVMGILVLQDILAILVLTVLGTLAVSKELDIDKIAPNISQLILTLVVFIVGGLFFIPKYIKKVSLIKNPELLIIVSTGLCFVMAASMQSFGYSVALGAFLAGVLIAESGEAKYIVEISRPMKDVFVAIFFVSVGMGVDPVLAFEYLPQALLLAFCVIAAQFTFVVLGSILSGAGLNKSLYSGLALGQIGEFSFIISGVAVAAGIAGKEFQVIIVTAAIITSFTSPILWKKSKVIVAKVSKNTPSSVRVAIGFIEAWYEKIASYRTSNSKLLGIPKKIIIGLVVDFILLLFLPPLLTKYLPDILGKLGLSSSGEVNHFLSLGIICLVMLPIVYGFFKMASSVVINISSPVFSEAVTTEENKTLKLFRLSIWAGICLLAMLPAIIVFRFFYSGYVVIAISSVFFLGLIYTLIKTAGGIAFEYETGSGKLLNVIKNRTQLLEEESNGLEVEMDSFPGMDESEIVIMNNSNFDGKTLSELDIRAKTGATIVSIVSSSNKIMFPVSSTKVFKGDRLRVFGNPEAIERIKSYLDS